MIQVILSLSELPIVSGEVIPAKIPPPHVVRFDIRKDDLQKLHMVIRSRSLVRVSRSITLYEVTLRSAIGD